MKFISIAMAVIRLEMTINLPPYKFRYLNLMQLFGLRFVLFVRTLMFLKGDISGRQKQRRQEFQNNLDKPRLSHDLRPYALRSN